MRAHLAAVAFGVVFGVTSLAWGQEVWSFNGANGTNLGTSFTALSTPSSIATVVSGFTTTGAGVDIIQKNLGGPEVGLGLSDDPSGLNEDTNGNFIQLSLSNLSATQALSLSIGTNSSSVDFNGNAETWGIAFSNTSGLLGTIARTGTGNGVVTVNAGSALFVDVTDTSSGAGNGILLSEMDAPLAITPTGVPEPASLPILATALAALMGLVTVRRRRLS